MSEQISLDLDDERLGRVVGVTTVLGYTLWPGDGVLRHAWKLGHRNVLLTDARAHEARTLGLDLHRAAEQLARGERIGVQAYPVPARGAIESLVAWWRIRRPRVLASELPLQNLRPDVRVRGRVDLVMECDRPDCDCTGGVLLADYKLTDGLAGKHRLQVGGGYRLLWEGAAELPPELQRRPFCGGELVLVDREGGQATSEPIDDRAAGFRAALALYRDMERAEDLPEKTL